MSKKKQPKIIVSVTNDLVTDNRVHKVCTSLIKFGFQVLLIGRTHHKSLPLAPRKYATKRFRLIFQKGPAFYAEYNFRLFVFLLFTRFDVVLANDLDSLAANFLTARFKQKPLVYDSHEYFTEVPELIRRPKIKRIWEKLEKSMLPKIKHAYTVCDSIAQIYNQKYKVNFKVVRNIPQAESLYLGNVEKPESDKKTILYQGAVNIGRGLEQAILAMKFIENAKLVIVGDGDIKPDLEALVKYEKLHEKVEFLGRLSIEQLKNVTPTANLGISIEEDLGLNYRFALPNKLFDYIHAGIPLLVSNLPEMKTIVEKYKIGEITSTLNPPELAEKLKTALFDIQQRKTWKINLKKAARELSWENEEKVLKKIYLPFI